MRHLERIFEYHADTWGTYTDLRAIDPIALCRPPMRRLKSHALVQRLLRMEMLCWKVKLSQFIYPRNFSHIHRRTRIQHVLAGVVTCLASAGCFVNI